MPQKDLPTDSERRAVSLEKTAALLLSIVTALVAIAGSYAVATYRIGDLERRVTSIESIKADQTAVAVAEQSNQIRELTQIVRTDHDALIRLAVSLEQNRK